ncbi:MAG: hypothetical protein R3Y13_00085 [bacterium]
MSYLKNKINENKIVIYHFLSVIPLLIYGCYKNGLKLYIGDLVGIGSIFYPVLCILPAALLILFIKLIRKRDFVMNDFYMFSVLLFLPYSFNILLAVILFAVFYFLYFTKLKLPFNILFVLLLYFVGNAFGSNDILNIAESTKVYNYALHDLFIGTEVSFMFTSSFLFSIITYFILNASSYYKTLIPFVFLISYVILTFVLGFFIDLSFMNLAGIFIAILIMGASFEFSPITKIGMICYAISLSVLTIICNCFIDYYIGVFVAMFILQLLSYYVVRKIFTK